jgi:hypothetical protein
MTIPDYVDARWIATLGNAQLIKAEAQLHSVFRKQENVEKARSGARYMLLVSNEARTRGLSVNHAK